MTAIDKGGPLDGLRIIDMSGMISGGFATMLFGDFGADVVMVEHPEFGDPIREWSQKTADGVSLAWKSIGRNKRCITLNLGTKEGRDLALDLISDADVCVENFRPGTMEKWGLSPDEILATNPEIILVRLSGYGQDGPKSAKPGFGTIAEGIAGWAHANGYPDRGPLLPPISLADIVAALFATSATLMAIYEREGNHGGSGKGQVIDVSLIEPLFRTFFGDVEAFDRLGYVRERTGNRHPRTAPRNIYDTKDGQLTLSASNQRIFERVAQAIERPDIIADPRFRDNESRVENVAALDEIIGSWTIKRSTSDAIDILEEFDAIVGPVYDISDIFDDEQFIARNDIIQVEDPEVGAVKSFAPIPKFSRTPGSVDFLGPQHGEHNDEVYIDELGLTREKVNRLRENGVI